MNVPFVDLSRIHSSIKEDVLKAIQDVIDRNDFILGKHVATFEEEFSRYEGARYGIGIANGTDGILLSLKACGIQRGDEVITQAHTFIASGLGITYAEAKPVFADIDEESFTLDPKSAERYITKKTKAILPVSLYGQPPDIQAFENLARSYNLKLIFDNAQSHGATYNNKPIGIYGDACSYSFYPGKNLGAFGDGGCVTTNKKTIANNLILLRNIGRRGWYRHTVKGYNSRLDTIQAAILSVKLKHLATWTEERRKIAAIYHNLLADVPIILPKEIPGRTHVYHLYVIRTKQRKKLMQYLLDQGIQTSIHYPIPVHKQIAYRERNKEKLPISENVAREVVSLPFFVGITLKEQEYVADRIKKFFHTLKRR
ncbi:MAG: DegT/DnrJ/EryC1/StrS family aminotransferase [Patescibacteria group bacterium]|nr:DegT/DnrJ/EryC1/StrS family aminotransferase [Patescibacteria group bacterium]